MNPMVNGMMASLALYYDVQEEEVQGVRETD